MPRRSSLGLLALALLAAAAAACAGRRPAPPPPPPPAPGLPLEPEPPSPAPVEEELVVRPVEEPIVVAAWTEPRQLPAGGGEVQVLVRVQKRGGKRFPGVEVRLSTSSGTLFSGGRVLVTDAQGMTRDRLAARRPAVVTLNAGGTRYRFQVPVAPSP
jgi:hypothetical protein